MDKKLKLNAKMNVAMAVCDFWIQVSALFSKLRDATLDKALKTLAKERLIIREMLNEDYSESYKDELREVLKTSIEDLV